jgi:hypothetical protein
MTMKQSKLVSIGLAAITLATTAQADDQRRDRREHRQSHNYIIERQEAGQVSGVPTSRLIIGRREIDVYSDGAMFEKNNYVGQEKR